MNSKLPAYFTIMLIAIIVVMFSCSADNPKAPAPALPGKTTEIAKWEQEGRECVMRVTIYENSLRLFSTTCDNGVGLSVAMSSIDYPPELVDNGGVDKE